MVRFDQVNPESELGVAIYLQITTAATSLKGSWVNGNGHIITSEQAQEFEAAVRSY